MEVGAVGPLSTSSDWTYPVLEVFEAWFRMGFITAGAFHAVSALAFSVVIAD